MGEAESRSGHHRDAPSCPATEPGDRGRYSEEGPGEEAPGHRSWWLARVDIEGEEAEYRSYYQPYG